MSQGRLDLGVGTGWMDLEHDVFGLPFPTWSERFARLSEALPYLRAAFGGGSHSGDYYSLDADVKPRPAGTRIIVGGSGAVRTPTLAGTHADEYNHLAVAASELAPKIEVMRRAAADAGRDPDGIEVTVMGQVITGRDEADFRERLGEAAAARQIDPKELLGRWKAAGLPVGTPDQVAETIAGLERAGVSRYYLQWLDVDDRQGLEMTWSVLAP